MSGNLKAFLEAAMADPDLREKLAKMDAGEIVAAARERGFELTEADLAPAEGEVNDEELGNVAGGGRLGPLHRRRRGHGEERGRQ